MERQRIPPDRLPLDKQGNIQRPLANTPRRVPRGETVAQQPMPRRSAVARFDELEAGLSIDKMALDSGLAQQPQLFFEVADQYALAVSERDAAAQNLKEVEAKVDQTVRDYFARIEEKITEKGVEGRVRLSEDYVKAQRELADAALKAGRLGALVEAYKQRSHALRDLSSLYVTSYYDGTDRRGVREAMNTERQEYLANRRRKGE
jgi:hypothetical protein